MIAAADLTAAERYEAQAAAALSAVDVRPPAALLWYGRRIAVVPSQEPAIEGAAPTRKQLVAAVGWQLHADFHGDGTPRPWRRHPVTALGEGGDFLRALSQANCGRGSWQAGWRVAGSDDDRDPLVVVRADGLRMLAPAEECAVEGIVARVRVPKELIGHRPGLYTALGDSTPRADAGADLTTLFWSLAAAGAVTFVARATYALNRADMPFRLTLLDNPARYGRADAVALSVARTDVTSALTLLRPLLRALARHLADSAPAFCKPLARGLALAEEPLGAERFGEHRCRLLAEAIVSASERGLRTPAQRLAVVRERFQTAGVSLDAPYRQAGSVDATQGS